MIQTEQVLLGVYIDQLAEVFVIAEFLVVAVVVIN